MSAPDPETERLLGELIAVLAGAYADADRRGITRRRHALTRTQRDTAGNRIADNSALMRPLAVRLALAVAARDSAGMHAVLGMPRSKWEWRQLAVALAAIADPAQLGGTVEDASARSAA